MWMFSCDSLCDFQRFWVETGRLDFADETEKYYFCHRVGTFADGI